MSEQNQTINVDDIAVIGDRLPAGRGYIARIGTVEGKKSRNDKPCVYATFEVIKGEHEGKEATCFFSLSVTKGKDGRTYASGIVEMKRIFAAIGKPLAANFGFPLNEQTAAQLLHKKLQGLQVELAVIEEKDRNGATDDNGNVKVYTRTKVIGLANKPAPVESADTVAVADEYDG